MNTYSRPTPQTLRNRTNRLLRPFNNYFDEIPLSDIFEVVRQNIGEVLDIDGTPWSGFLCGESGSVHFPIQNFRNRLTLTWYKMQSGRYEIVTYIA